MFSALRAVSGDASATSSTQNHASGPKFPSYLLPSFSMPFRNRRQSSIGINPNPIGATPPHENAVPPLSSSPEESAPSTPVESPTSPSFWQTSRFAFSAGLVDDKSGRRRSSVLSSTFSTSPPASAGGSQSRRLSKTQPNTIRCSTCATDFAYCSQVVSKGFTGRYGRAYLISPNPNGNLLNVKVGKTETRLLVTGSHVVADITCAVCNARVGWKYVDAKEESQKYKVGKFILETQRIVDFRSWEDIPENEHSEEDVADFGPVRRRGSKHHWPGDQNQDGDDVVMFDSEDEEDCDDLFSGSWDPSVAAKRRARRVNQRGKAHTSSR